MTDPDRVRCNAMNYWRASRGQPQMTLSEYKRAKARGELRRGRKPQSPPIEKRIDKVARIVAKINAMAKERGQANA